MKQLKNLKASSKKLLAYVLAFMTFTVSCLSALSIVSFADGGSAVTATDDHTLFSDDFDGTTLNSAWKQQQTDDGYGYTVADGSVTFNKGSNVRSSIYLDGDDYKAVNQRASIEFVSPSSKTFCQTLWLRYENLGSQNQSTGSKCRGYFVQYAGGGNEISVCRWVYGKGTTVTSKNALGSFGFNQDKNEKVRLEMVATGSNPTLLTVRIYVYNASTSAWKLKYANSYVDNTPELQDAGTVAIASAAKADTSIDKFEYSSTDNVTGNYYIKKSDNVGNGVYKTFGQVVTLEPGKEYVLSARYSKAAKQESLWVEYSGKDNGGQLKNETRLLTSVDNCDTGVTDGYNTLSYTFTVPSSGTDVNTTRCWYDSTYNKVGRARVLVGFRISDAVRSGTFTHFELYAADDENKTNLLVNSDFKMGLYGWDDDFGGTSNYNNWSPAAESTQKSANDRVVVASATDDEYKGLFAVPEDRDPLTFLKNTYYNLTVKKELTVGYLGGSVTSGYGASDQETKSWRGLTTSWLKEKFPQAEISAFNAAIGSTGSYSAAFRYQREVAAKSPDLLFIEFAINDKYNELTYEQSLRSTESVIRTAYDNNPYVEIVIVITADFWCRTDEYDNYRALKALAEKYDFMCVDIRKDFLSTLSDTEYRSYMMSGTDGVHPNDSGYQKYFELIEKKLSRDIVLDSAQTVSYETKKLPSSNLSTQPLMLNADSVRPSEITFTANSGWTVKNEAFSTITSDRGYSSVLTATQADSEFSFKFIGTDVGLFYQKSPDGGKISVSIDGGTAQVIDSYQSNQNHSTVICGWNLAEAEHTVTVKLLSEKNSESTGSNFTIGALLLNQSAVTDSSKTYMIQNNGTRDYAKFGQVFSLDKNASYSYSVSYKYFNQNESRPIIMYKTAAGGKFTELKTYTETEDENYYRTILEFTIPEDAYTIDGKAEIMVGYTSGKKGSSGYFYDFLLYNLSDTSKTNMFSNSLFKQGFKDWTGDAKGYAVITAEGELSYNSGEAKLKVADESLFKKKFLSGKYMVYNTGTANYGKFGQLFEVEPGTSYVFSCQVKYIGQSACKPIAMYFRQTAPNTHVTIEWTESVEDKDNSSFTGTVTIPEDANVLSNGKVELFVGYTTGATGANAYFADFLLYNAEDTAKTNMFTNADFKFGFVDWRADSKAAPVTEYGLTLLPNGSAELLPYDESLFINDSNDNKFNDGDWYSVFGEDEDFDAWMKRVGAYYVTESSTDEDGEWVTTVTNEWKETLVPADDTDETEDTVVSAEKETKKRKKKVAVTKVTGGDYTLWIIIGSIVAVLGVGGAVTVILLRTKSKKFGGR